MSKRYQPSTNNNSFSGVLPDIVANFKTAMCNPYDKPKVITNRSKTPVPKISTNRKSVVPASTGLPAGLFGQQAKLANFKIPKLKRSTCNSTSKSTASSTTQSRNSSVSYKTPSKLLTAKSSRKPTTYLPKVRQRVSQQSKRTHHTATTNPKHNVPTTKFEFSIAATTTVTTKSLNMFIKDRDLGHTASLHVRGMKLSGATHLTLVHMSRGSGVMTWWEQSPDQWRGPICPTCSPISQRGFSNFVLWSRVQFHQSCLPLKVRRKSK